MVILYKSGLELEKRLFLLENDEKASLLLEIDMIVLYSLKIASFGYFRRKTQFFPAQNDKLLYFSILTKRADPPGLPLGSK